MSCPAGKPHLGQSHSAGTSTVPSSANDGLVSCPFAHQYETLNRAIDSPRSASPIGPAPTRLPRIALPPAIIYSFFLILQ